MEGTSVRKGSSDLCCICSKMSAFIVTVSAVVSCVSAMRSQAQSFAHTCACVCGPALSLRVRKYPCLIDARVPMSELLS